mmetsp:Transcript_12308/g.20699  ORF Transcript_12308/g.20699 Transcript_12308/m.20699 type:complete len:101 (-) Transcript_12308:507-809(-)
MNNLAKFAMGNKQPTKIKRQFNLNQGGTAQGPIINYNSSVPSHNLAWNAHRNSSVKPRQNQIRGTNPSTQGPDQASNQVRGHTSSQKDAIIRPGTAPKQP